MAIKPWDVISEKIIVERSHGRGVKEVLYRLPDNKKSSFLIFDVRDIVTILAITREQEVILINQNAAGPNKPIIGLPGGEAKGTESPEEAAARELLEESGFSGKIEVVTYIYQGLYRNGKSFCAVATDCEQTAERNLDPTEFLETMFVSIEKLKEMLLAGEIKSDVGMIYLCLHHLNLL